MRYSGFSGSSKYLVLSGYGPNLFFHLMSCEFRLQINVEAGNRNSPAFSSLIYEVGCLENSPDEHLVAQLSAFDPDRSVYGEIKYFVADADEPGLFSISPRTGEVRLSVSPGGNGLDRERKESHVLQIGAEDGGGWLGFTKLAVKVS